VTNMADPVRSGVTTSLAHPDRNLTGFSLAGGECTAGKLLELLQETVPHLSSVAMIANLEDAAVPQRAKEIESVAAGRGIRMRVIQVRNPDALDGAFKQARKEAQAALLVGDSLTFEHRQKIAALAARYRLSTIYPFRESVEAGGLIAYAPDRAVL